MVPGVMDGPRQQPSASTGTFSVMVAGVAGGQPAEVTDLHPNMDLSAFCEHVAAQVGIPAFAVRLLHGTRVLHMSCMYESLASVGVQPGASLTLVKQFGWAKPDLRMLAELQGRPVTLPKKEMLPCSDVSFDLEKCQAERRHLRDQLLKKKQRHIQSLQRRQQWRRQQQHRHNSPQRCSAQRAEFTNAYLSTWKRSLLNWGQGRNSLQHQMGPPSDHDLQQHQQLLPGKLEVDKGAFMDAYLSTWRQSQLQMCVSDVQHELHTAGGQKGETQGEPRQREKEPQAVCGQRIEMRAELRQEDQKLQAASDEVGETKRRQLQQELQPTGGHDGETRDESRSRQSDSAATPPFSVAVSSVTGTLLNIPNLQPHTQVSELCQKVALSCSMPLFAVRLLHQSDVLHMSWTGVSLADLGLKQGSQLMLVKQFGWARPDLHKLCELQRQWQGR